MAENLPGLLLWDRARRLFEEMKHALGEDEARKIFRYLSDDVPDDEIRELKNLAILQRVNAMQPLNRAELARELVSENDQAAMAGLPPPNGPRGSRDVMTMDKHIRNLIKQRDDGLADGTWISIGKTAWPKKLSNRLALLMAHRSIDTGNS
jgi:hypothetical protein